MTIYSALFHREARKGNEAMQDQSDEKAVLLIFIFTAMKDILRLFIILEELNSRFRCLPLS